MDGVCRQAIQEFLSAFCFADEPKVVREACMHTEPPDLTHMADPQRAS